MVFVIEYGWRVVDLFSCQDEISFIIYVPDQSSYLFIVTFE